MGTFSSKIPVFIEVFEILIYKNNSYFEIQIVKWNYSENCMTLLLEPIEDEYDDLFQ